MITIRGVATVLIFIFSLYAVAPAQNATTFTLCPPKMTDSRTPDHHVLSLDFSPCPQLQTEANLSPTFSFRVGDQLWHKNLNPGFMFSIEYTYADHFILVAKGDCTSAPYPSNQCSPFALMVQAALPEIDQNYPDKKEILNPDWKPLLNWDGKEFRYADNLDDFFQKEPHLRVVVNGTISVIGELTPPTPGQMAGSLSEALNKKAAKQNHSWAGKLLDPENDINVRIYSVPFRFDHDEYAFYRRLE